MVPRLIPGYGELRVYLDSGLEALGGGSGIVPFKVLLRLLVLAQGRVRVANWRAETEWLAWGLADSKSEAFKSR